MMAKTELMLLQEEYVAKLSVYRNDVDNDQLASELMGMAQEIKRIQYEERASRIKVVTAGRKDLADYFKLHVGKQGKLPNSPLLAFRHTDSGIAVEIVIKPEELLSLPDETPVMGIWPGQWKSDYFQFTVRDYREFYRA